MTRAEFVAEAKRRGKDKEETRRKFEELDAAGRFDDSPSRAAPASEPPTEPEPSVWQKIRDIDRDYTQRMIDRGLAATQNPTITGKALGKIGIEGIPAEIAETPERTVRLLGGAVGQLSETPIDIARIGNEVLGGLPGKALGAIAGKAKDVIEATPQAATAIPGVGGVIGAAKLLPDVAKGVSDLYEKYQGLPQEVRETVGPAAELVTELPLAKLATKYGPDILKKALGRGAARHADDATEAAAKALGRNAAGDINILADIPDVDEIARTIGATADDVPPMTSATSMKQIRKAAGEVPKKGIRQPGVTDDEAAFLSVPQKAGETPFPEVMKQAQAGKVGRLTGAPSALDKAGEIAVKAYDKIEAARRAVGKKLSSLLSATSKEQADRGVLISATDIRDKAEKALTKFTGGALERDADGLLTGKIVKAAGREISTDDLPLARKIMNRLANVDDALTLQEAWDLRRNIDDMVDKYNTKLGRVNTPVKAMEDEISDVIDSVIKEAAGPEFQEASKKYARLRTIQKRLGERLGDVVETTTDGGKTVKRARYGASLLKSALMSNGDRNTKALFAAVKELTGVDLLREAGMAEIAMKAVGDPRINDLLQEFGALTSLARGDKLGAVMKVGQKAAEVVTGDKADQLLRFYNQAQKRGRSLGVLGSESGAIGGRFEQLTPAIKSPETGKVYSGWSHKQIWKEKLGRAEPSAEGKVWQAIFDDNTGAGSPYVGFIDKHGNFISRMDAERAIENMSTTAAFHGNTIPAMLGLTGAGAAGVLAGGAVVKDKIVPMLTGEGRGLGTIVVNPEEEEEKKRVQARQSAMLRGGR